jgi:hypothetical protein
MGLFRRGTKLLKIGSGLRDCCCRPENPEECWCPDLCRYYFSFGGTQRLSAREVLREITCTPGGEASTERNYDSYGLATIPGTARQFHEVRAFSDLKYINLAGTGVVGSPTGDCYYLLFSYISNIAGNTPQTAFTDQFNPQFPFSQEIYYQTFLQIIAYPGASYFYPDQPPSTWGVAVSLAQQVLLVKYGFGSQATLLYKRSLTTIFPVSASCIADSRYECSTVTPNRLHTLSLDTELTIDPENGVVCEGNTYGWTSANDFPADVDLGYTEWHVAEEYPLATNITVSIKSLPSCQPGDCDCEVDLTGRTVVFKGKTFTYGSGDEFTSDDGSEFWEESPTGVFRKVTYDACDVSQQFIALEETAEIICSETIEEGQFWAVFFTVECRERDACGGAFDRSRTTLFNGIFTCDSEGFPSGTPTVELANDQLSDPAPTGDCASFPAAPSINFT